MKPMEVYDVMTAAAMVSAGAASNGDSLVPLLQLMTRNGQAATIGHLHGVAMFCRDVTRNTVHDGEVVCGHYLQLTACAALKVLADDDPESGGPLAVCSSAINNTTDHPDPTLIHASQAAMRSEDTLRDFLRYTLGVFGHVIHHATTSSASVLCTGINRPDGQ